MTKGSVQIITVGEYSPQHRVHGLLPPDTIEKAEKLITNPVWRKRRGFLWIPVELEGKSKWLCRATWIEQKVTGMDALILYTEDTIRNVYSRWESEPEYPWQYDQDGEHVLRVKRYWWPDD